MYLYRKIGFIKCVCSIASSLLLMYLALKEEAQWFLGILEIH